MAQRFAITINTNFLPAAFVVLLFWGVNMCWSLNNLYQVTTFQPTQVRIVDSHIERTWKAKKNGNGYYTYRPVIRYSYQIDKHSYTSDKVMPRDEQGTLEWAKEIVYRYNIEEAYTGYVNPHAPHSAFLIKTIDTGPYWMLLIMSPLLLLFGAGTLFTGGDVHLPGPIAQADGWYLLGVQPVRERAIPMWAIIAIGWFGMELVTLGPYFLFADESSTWLTVGAFMYTCVGVVLVRTFAKDPDADQPVSTARVIADREQFMRGDSVTLRTETLVLSPVQVAEMTLGLVCDDCGRNADRSKGRPVAVYEDRVPLLKTHAVQTGETLVGSHTFTLPPHKHLLNWRIEVVIRNRNGALYTTRVPITVYGSEQGYRWRVGDTATYAGDKS